MNLFVSTLVVSCLQITELTIHGQLRQSFIIRLKRLSLMMSIDVHATQALRDGTRLPANKIKILVNKPNSVAMPVVMQKLRLVP